MCVRIIVYNCRTQHSTEQFFPLIHQTIVIAQTMSIGGEWVDESPYQVTMSAVILLKRHRRTQHRQTHS